VEIPARWRIAAVSSAFSHVVADRFSIQRGVRLEGMTFLDDSSLLVSVVRKFHVTSPDLANTH
jgi:hypothetical protein